jgi:HSP20 family protein
MQWNPLREMDDLMARFQRGLVPTRAAAELGSWAPAVDISESAKEYTLKAELPGVKKEDVKLTVQNGVLTLSGERRFEHEDKDAKHHRIERAYGSYSRSFSLPEDVLEDKINAECKEGVVTVRLPKTDLKSTAGKTIAVQ